MNKIALFIASLSISVFATAAEHQSDENEAADEKCPQLQASTIFVPEKGKKGSAEKINEAHKNAEAQGWNFNSLVLYTEDSDLEGFYVTYTRPHPCID